MTWATLSRAERDAAYDNIAAVALSAPLGFTPSGLYPFWPSFAASSRRSRSISARSTAFSRRVL